MFEALPIDPSAKTGNEMNWTGEILTRALNTFETNISLIEPNTERGNTAWAHFMDIIEVVVEYLVEAFPSLTNLAIIKGKFDFIQ